MGPAALDDLYDPAKDMLLGLALDSAEAERFRGAALDRPVSVRARVDGVLHTWLYRFDPPPPEAHRGTSQ